MRIEAIALNLDIVARAQAKRFPNDLHRRLEIEDVVH